MERFGLTVLVPIVAIFCIFGLPILAFIFFRAMAHRERMAIIRSGIAPDPGKAAFREHFSKAVKAHDNTGESPQRTLRKGIRTTAIGLALTIGLSFIGFQDGASEHVASVSAWSPGPWLIGGLVPLFVGLSQVTIALISGATLRPPMGPSAQSEPTMQREGPFTTGTGPTTPTYATYDTSYTYRPDGTSELRPPTAPPERRL